jgi:hypothetical protein
MAALSAVAIVSTERKGKTDRNGWDTACGNFKTSISSLCNYKNGALYFSFFITKIIFLSFVPLLFGSDIYRQQATTFSALA